MTDPAPPGEPEATLPPQLPELFTPKRWLSPQVILGVGGLLTFVLVPVSINTVYEGLPAHPLLLHVPVILIPTMSVVALVIVTKGRWFERHCVWLCAIAVVALGALNLTMGAGNALRRDLGLFGDSPTASLIARHAHAAGILRLFTIGFTAVLIVAVALDLHRRGQITGIGWIDALIALTLRLLRSVRPARALLALLALGCLYFVFLTGDLGARAVWQGRVHSTSFGPGAGAGYDNFPR